MILVDTSVWIDHLRSSNAALASLLNNTRVIMHPFVLGELACGNLQNRREILTLLGDLPKAPVATDTEVLFFIESRALMGKGIGYVDAHLLAATSLANGATLWTKDRRLVEVAAALNVGFAG